MRDAWADLVHGSRCAGCDRPGRVLCPACASRLPVRAPGRWVSPTPRPPGLARCRAAGEYAGLLRALVLAHKEHGALSLARPLGQVLAAVVAGALPRLPPAAVVLLVPVPSRGAVVRRRGHDPMLRVTRAAARRLRARDGPPPTVVAARLLAVRRVVADQAGLDAAGRSANVAGSVGVRRSALAALSRAHRPVVVVLCDDVLTTGATARECQRALEDAGVPVAAVATIAATRRRLPARREVSSAAGPGGQSRQALPKSGPAL